MPMKTCIDCGMVFPAENYGVWRKDQMLAEQKAREELEAALARNEKHRKKKERQSE